MPYAQAAVPVWDLGVVAGASVSEMARTYAHKPFRLPQHLDRLLNANDGGLGRTAGASVAELQQLMIDARSASNELRELARTLRERPSSVLFEPQAAGVEIPR